MSRRFIRFPSLEEFNRFGQSRSLSDELTEATRSRRDGSNVRQSADSGIIHEALPRQFLSKTRHVRRQFGKKVRKVPAYQPLNIFRE